jgi:hypothetical protein
MNNKTKDAFFLELHRSMLDSDLSYENHPMLARLSGMTVSELRTVIENYSCLSNRAIQFLATALVYSQEWPNLYREIERNIEEEKGINTGGVSHLAIMRKGYKEDLGIDTTRVKPLKCTKDFLESMNNIFLDSRLPFVAGAVLAFESAAVEEFKIIDSIVRQYLFLQGKRIGGLTEAYINGHKDFEVEHSNGLRKAIMSHMSNHNDHSDRILVEWGFNSVCQDMSKWWLTLRDRANKRYHRNKEK